MQRIANFQKVSWAQFLQDWRKSFSDTEIQIQNIYDDLRLPKRATTGSAGYDFYAPTDIELRPQETIKIPTGIRASMVEGWVLMLFPRSSLGFTYRLQFDNTVGIIDSDYYHSKNEGHIFIKLTNDTKEDKVVRIKANEGFAQGIFLPFGIVEDDDVQAIRDGGFGSTNK